MLAASTQYKRLNSGGGGLQKRAVGESSKNCAGAFSTGQCQWSMEEARCAVTFGVVRW